MKETRLFRVQAAMFFPFEYAYGKEYGTEYGQKLLRLFYSDKYFFKNRDKKLYVATFWEESDEGDDPRYEVYSYIFPESGLSDFVSEFAEQGIFFDEMGLKVVGEVINDIQNGNSACSYSIWSNDPVLYDQVSKQERAVLRAHNNNFRPDLEDGMIRIEERS